MDDKAVFFQKIAIHRALGISQGDGFELSDISPGVNLVFGPNGSGKSTTALVIQELLWPGKTGLVKPTIMGRFAAENSTWSVEIDAGHAETQNALHTGATPNIGPVENRSRYLLALDDLIVDENTDFARIITAESQGGFDLDTAGDNLKFTSSPKKSLRAVNKAKEARQKVLEARAVQERISSREQLLPELERKRRKATDAERRISVLNQAVEFKNADSLCSQISDQIASFPEGVALLDGTEDQNLQKLSLRQQELEEKNAVTRQEKVSAIRTLMKLKMPDQLIQDDFLPAVRGLQNDLHKTEQTLDVQKRLFLYSESEANTAEKRIGDSISPHQLSSLNTVEIQDLSTLARHSDEVRAREIVLQERKRVLTEVEQEKAPDFRAEQIRDGILSLKRWLETADPAETSGRSSRTPLNTASLLLMILAGVLGFTYQLEWILLIIPAVIFFIWGRGKPERTDSKSTNSKSIYVSNYERTSLPAPDSWKTEAVLDLLGSLVDMADIKAQESRRNRNLSNLTEDDKALELSRSELIQQKTQVEEKLGFAVTLDNQWLPLLVQNISSWQKQSAAASSAKAVLSSLEDERQLLLNTIIEKMSPFGYSEILSAEHAAKSIEDVAAKLTDYHNAVRIRDTADGSISEIKAKLEGIRSERHGIFTRIGLDTSQDGTISNWLSLLPDFRRLQKELTEGKAIRKNRRERLSGYEDLLALDSFEIQEQIRNLQEESSKRDSITEKIIEITMEIEAAQAGHQLSNALSREDEAVSDLADLRELNSVSIAGDLLTHWVREVAIERARPLVFRRACELVAEFTNGHLKLFIDDRINPPQFNVSVNGSSPRPVDKLSNGERVQVLIAIRTAFLEQNEPVRLPLLLDEALGTSDDLRAGLIIDAVIKISQSGRQVFYFTAQHEELVKWISKLKKCQMPHTVINLAELRKLEVATNLPLEIIPVPSVSVPSPDGMTHEQYGAALKVGNINPLADNQDRLHLWHLIRDDDLLKQYLSYQIEKWGQLRTLIELGGNKLVNANPEENERIFTAARAVDAATRAWRIGRGRKVNRRVLQDSECVSDSFIDAVSDLSNSLHGSAAGIIVGLKNKVIKRWPSAKTDELQSYLENSGYLSTDSVLTPGEIRIRVLAAVAEAMSKRLIDSAHIDRIVSSLPK